MPKGVSMGLFTNRKRDDEGPVAEPEVLEDVAPSWFDDPPAPGVDPTEVPDEISASPGHEPSWFAATPPDPIPDDAAPFSDGAVPFSDGAVALTGQDHQAERTLADFGITLADDEPELPPGPRRRLNEQPSGTAQAGNVEIDADGLLEMLGVDPHASLQEISAARLRFVAQHDPAAEDDADAARIKERIRREVNTAYASFRLTRAG